jgi:DNA-binding transcriptional regulator YiaG
MSNCSEIYEVIYQSAIEKYKIGAISESKLKEYGKMCLAENPKKLDKPEEIKHTDFVTAYP